MALALGVLVRGERVAMLSVVGGVVCVAGAWLIRRAQMGPAIPREVAPSAAVSRA
ncbi:MAG TPA: hypothetical protein VI669_07800 [Vicinamibacteria bacterium]